MQSPALAANTQHRGAGDAGATSSATGRIRRGWRFARRYPRISISLTVLILVGLASLGAPLLAPYSPSQLIAAPLREPDSTHLLGTDDFGRDMLSRLLYAGRVSLGVSVSAVAIAAAVGVALGLMAGFYRGFAEFAIMRSIDLVLSFPTIVLAIAMVAFLGNSMRNMILVIALVYVPRFARVVYGSALGASGEEYVEAARVVGATGFYIMRKAILPNIAAPIFVQVSLSLGFAILVESGLSFLGLGVQPPTPSWGNMIADARPYIDYLHLLIAPCAVIGITILALNTLGDGLRDALDPRLHGSR